MAAAPFAGGDALPRWSGTDTSGRGQGPERALQALLDAAIVATGSAAGLILLRDGACTRSTISHGLESFAGVVRDLAFRAHEGQPVGFHEVEDLRGDPRFAGLAALGNIPARHYAGVTLAPDETAARVLVCVVDRTARRLGLGARQLMEHLAQAAGGFLDRLPELGPEADERMRLNSIVEATGAGTWQLNVRTGEVMHNRAWAALLGDRDPAAGTRTIDEWRQRVHEEDLERFDGYLGGTLADASASFVFEARMRLRDGSWIWVLNRGGIHSRLPDGTPEWIFGTQVDFSAHKRQEAALRRSEQLLKRSGDVAGIGGWELDLTTNVLTWSEQTYRIHGVGLDYVPSLEAAIDFFAPEARPLLHSAIAHGPISGSDWDLELPLVQAGGQHIWVRMVGNAEFENGRQVRLMGAIQDVTAHVRQREALSTAAELLKVTLQSIGDAVITTDASGAVSWLNPIAERMTGWTSPEAKGRGLGDVVRIVDEETRLPTDNPVFTCLELGKAVSLAQQALLISRHGDEFGIEDSASPIRSESGEVLGVVLVIRDVSEQRRMSGEMSYRASHDALTGLINRAEFEARLRKILNRAHEERSQHSLLFIDLDQFKIVNDACGHTAGDELLQHVGRLLGEDLRGTDTLARLGGDEFALILDGCAQEQALLTAQRICDRVDEFRFVHDGRRFRIGTSIGLVPIDHRWTTTISIVQAADAACYAAKEGGRNRVHVWVDTDEALRQRRGEVQWAARLEQALDEDKFVLFAQRIESLGAGAPGVHAEVLLRMVDSDGSLVPPAAFLPVAERFHLASRVDRWVLQHAIAELTQQADLSRVDTLSINLSGQSVGDRAFHRQATEILTQAGAEVCRRICLEIKETAAITNLVDAGDFIDQVRAIGVRIALDDFGAGASSFSYLKNLRVDFLKIDGRYIRDLVEDPLDDATVRCFVDVARVVGLKTTAEFVDRPEILDRVRAIGVDYAQGFLLHKPESIREVLQPTSVRTAPVGVTDVVSARP